MIKTTPDIIPNTTVELGPNWHPADRFSGDEMIDAYFLGRKAGIEAGWDEKFQILVKQFKTNIESAVSVSETLYKQASEIGIALKTIHLRSDGLSKFTALFVVDAKDFISDNFLNVYKISRKLNGNKSNPDIYISFLFTPASDTLNQDCLTADGYFLNYAKDQGTV